MWWQRCKVVHALDVIAVDHVLVRVAGEECIDGSDVGRNNEDARREHQKEGYDADNADGVQEGEREELVVELHDGDDAVRTDGSSW